MTLDPTAARSFIKWYKAILLEIESAGARSEHHNVLAVLGAARARLAESPALLDDAVGRLRSKAEPVDEHVIAAVRTLSVQDWVFLRDTTRYSLFLNASGSDAYAVAGLTEPIRQFSQGSGVFIKTGVVEFSGRFVCDGLVTRIVRLGSGIRRSFANSYREAKAAGRFHLRPNCECCNADLPPGSADARICSFECTFCRSCAEEALAGRCPNCGGELVARPRRPAEKLARFPASTERVYKPAGCGRPAA